MHHVAMALALPHRMLATQESKDAQRLAVITWGTQAQQVSGSAATQQSKMQMGRFSIIYTTNTARKHTQLRSADTQTRSEHAEASMLVHQ